MVTVRFFPIDIDYTDKIRVFGKTEDGKRITILDDNIKPFFYVLPTLDANILKKEIDNIKIDKFSVVNTEIVTKDYLGEDCDFIKVFINREDGKNPIIGEIATFDNVSIFESDVPIIKKYLIEKDITPLSLCEAEGELKNDPLLGPTIEGVIKEISKDEIIKPKTLAIDIEVYSPATAISEDNSDPIISVSFVGNDGFQKVFTWKEYKNKKDYVEFVKSEADLIIKLRDTIENYSPDFIVGYNSDGFDFPYIIKRADRFGISLNLGADGSKIKMKRGDPGKVKIKGIVHIDLLQFIRKIMSGSLKLDSYSLDSVSNFLLQDKKKDIDIWKLNEIWDNEKDIEKICEYNLHDSILTLKLFEKILVNLNELVKLIGIPIYDISRMSYGQLIENYLMKKAKELNTIIPNKPSYSQISERMRYTYQGAFVMEPIPNFYKNLVLFDFMSLYPTIIVSKNICPSTINNSEGYESPVVKEGNKEITYFFDNKQKGFIPKIIEELILKRNKIKELLKKEKNPILQARSYALKTVANACYGYMGFFGARWYCKECAASITAWAREYIKDVIKKCEDFNLNVVYSDTDSVAIEIKDKTKKDILEFVKEINKKLPGLMELELEKFYPYGIFVSKKGETQGAKKKYALIDEEGEIKISGFETVRRDWSKIARDTQKKVLEIILKENSPEKAKLYATDIVEKLRNKKIPIKELIIQTQLKMNLESYEQIGPHVAVARRMKEKGIKVVKGMAIWFVITEGKGMIRDRAKMIDEVNEGEYDSEYYINNQIIPAVEKIFEIFNISKEDLLTRGKQTNLSNF